MKGIERIKIKSLQKSSILEISGDEDRKIVMVEDKN